MTETLNYDPSDPDAPEFSEDEQNSLEVAEKLGQEENELLAGKYKDAEELEQAYIELQRKMGEKSEPDSKEVEPDSEPVDEKSTEDEEINPFEDDQQADVVFRASEEWAENGEISAETQEAIKSLINHLMVKREEKKLEKNEKKT